MEMSVLTVLWEFVGDYWPHLTIASSPAIYSLLRAVVMAYSRRPKSTAGDIGPYFTDKKLLAPPLARPAYSDRMAYVLAEMSDLAYRPFEGPRGVIDDAVDKARSLNVTNDADLRAFLDQFSTQLLSGRYLNRNTLKNILGNSGFALLDVIDVDETQGFVCRRDVDGEPPYLVLAFRGTEMKVSDWLTDARCVPRVEGKAKVHTGFIEAFTVRKNGEGRTVKEVVEEILGRPEAMDQDGQRLPLFITGHSLGGALALLATKLVAPNVSGACYTFGAPRVGNYEYFRFIKTPVYRVVNSADVVPRVPPGVLSGMLVGIVQAMSWLGRLIPVVAPALDKAEGFLGKMQGYRHYGDLRYLTDVAAGRFQDVRLLLNPPAMDRLVWMWRHLAASLFVPLKSHSMNIYRRKLWHVANDRNR